MQKKNNLVGGKEDIHEIHVYHSGFERPRFGINDFVMIPDLSGGHN